MIKYLPFRLFALVSVFLFYVQDSNAVITFTDAGAGLPTVWRAAVAWGDYDNDGDLDVVVTGETAVAGVYTSKLYKNTAGIFAEDNASTLQNVCNGTVSWGDYDADGDLDLLLTGQTASTQTCTTMVYKNTAGILAPVATSLTGVYLSATSWADYDGDGDLDFVISGLTTASVTSGISIVYKNTNGIFANAIAGLQPLGFSSLAWGDYDNDGDPDLALGGFTSSGTYRSYLCKNTNGLFADAVAGLAGANRGSLAWGDYDVDGDLDLLLSGSSDGTVPNPVTKIYNNNAGVLTDMGSLITAMSYTSAAWGDYDNDGDLDILMTGVTAAPLRKATIWQNNAGTFTDAGFTIGGGSWGSVTWVDYDNDGDLDAMIAGTTNSVATGANTKLYKNEGGTVNTFPSAPTGLTATPGTGGVSLSWTKPTDAQTPQAGLTYNLRIGTTSGSENVRSSMASADGVRRISAHGQAEWNSTGENLHLPVGTYFWSVQAIDGGLKGGPFATEGTFSVTQFSSSTAQVTLLVQLINGMTVSPNGVHIAGTFQNWDATATSLTSIGNNTFEYVMTVQKGSYFEYKFLNGNAWGTEETVLGPCSYNPVTNPNRFLLVPNKDTILTVGFGSCSTILPYPEPRIAFVGSSSTYGHGSPRPAYMSYPGQFAKLMAGTNVTVGNFGRNSTALQKQTVGPPSYWNSVDLPLALSFKPNVLFMNLGANDVKSTLFKTNLYRADFKAMMDTFRLGSPDLDVVVALTFKTALSTEPLCEDSLRPAMKQISTQYGLSLLDFYKPTLVPAFHLNADNTHTDSVGQSIMAKHLYDFYNTPKPVVIQVADSMKAPAGYVGYRWYKNGDTVSILQGGTSPKIKIDAIGAKYKVLVTLTDTADDRLVSKEAVSTLTANQPFQATNTWKLFPNPTSNEVTISGSEPFRSVHIQDVLGRVVNLNSTESQSTLKLGHLQAGIYYLHINGAENRKEVLKLVKE